MLGARDRAETLGAECWDCPFNKGTPVFPAAPPKVTKMIVCGEAPGRQEEEQGRYFIGRSGTFFNKILTRFDISPKKLHVTNACMCRPTFAPSPRQWEQALLCCRPRLVAELYELKSRARTILAFGKRAMHGLCRPAVQVKKTGEWKLGPGYKSILNWMGAPIQGAEPFQNYSILPTVHPAFCLRPDGRSYTPVCFIHTDRAWALATNQLEEWEWPPFFIEPNEEALRALEEMYAEKLPVGFDIETRGTNPMQDLCMCIGLANSKVSVSVPWESYRARKDELVPGITETTVGRRIAQLAKRILSDKRIPKVFQNGPHDILGAERLNLPINNYQFDTLLAHNVVFQGIKHSLGVIAAIEYHAPRWKEEKHTASNEKGHEKFSRRDPRELRLYNAKDAWMTVKLMEPLSVRLNDTHKGWDVFNGYMTNIRIAIKMQRRGVQVDRSKLGVHKKKLSQRRARARHEYKSICKAARCFKRFNPNSHHFNRQLFFRRFRVRPRYYSEKTGAPSLNEKFLTELVAHPNQMVGHAARALLRYRRWNKLISTYIVGMPVDSKGITHPSWNVAGARTLRWACADPNLMNIPKPVIEKTKKGTMVVKAPGLRDLFVGHRSK